MNTAWLRLKRNWPSFLVVVYTLAGWPLGVYFMLRDGVGFAVLGVALVCHTLMFSAYLIHDCAHHALFSTRSANDRLGVLMSWLNGACLADYSRLKKKHLRHHSDRLDVVTFDYRQALLRAPLLLRRAVLVLEWGYFPAVELLLRGMVIAAPFNDGTRGQRIKILVLLAMRVLFFGALGAVSFKALALYALAYVIFLTVLRFFDAFQHTYEVLASRSLEAAVPDPRRDLRYEYENTYSNLIAERWGWLNLLVLNFPYHNAHHVRPGVPWHRLPALHRTLYGAGDRQVITCRHLLAGFHRHRVARILAQDYGSVAATGDRTRGFLGAVGVSFLTAV
jgi:fatty acid desaturase